MGLTAENGIYTFLPQLSASRLGSRRQQWRDHSSVRHRKRQHAVMMGRYDGSRTDGSETRSPLEDLG
jgi:hypothetical protein